MTDRYSERGGQRWDDGERRYRDRDYSDGERGFLERFSDEVRSWFGDEDAQRRRMRDEREDWRGRGDWTSRESGRGDWGGRESGRSEWGRASRSDWMRGPDEREWSRDWGHVEGRGQGLGRGGMSSGYDTRSSSGYGGYGGWNRERDWMARDWMTGRYTGRGPRNYQRSDERIREDICERFTENSQLDPSDVEIRVQSGDVTLDGTVSDRGMKRTAEDLAESVSGVRAVHNLIRVVTTEPGRDFTGGDQRQQGEQGRTGPQRGSWAA
jgi:hypothetical protein